MSEFGPALDYLLDNEDKARSYAIVPDPGGNAIAGINSASFPTQYAAVAAAPQAQRGELVANFYFTAFWSPLELDFVNSQDIANRVLDQAVNGGPYSAIAMLQECANSLGGAIAVDGTMGTLTLHAVNACDAGKLLDAYRKARVEHYEAVLEAHPKLEMYRATWMARASK